MNIIFTTLSAPLHSLGPNLVAPLCAAVPVGAARPWTGQAELRAVTTRKKGVAGPRLYLRMDSSLGKLPCVHAVYIFRFLSNVHKPTISFYCTLYTLIFSRHLFTLV